METFAKVFGIFSAIIGLVAAFNGEFLLSAASEAIAIYLFIMSGVKIPRKTNKNNTNNSIYTAFADNSSQPPPAHEDLPQEDDTPGVADNLCNTPVEEKRTSYYPKKQRSNSQFKTTNITVRTNLDKLSNFIAIDCETTGLNANKDAIVEIAAIRFKNWEPIDEFSTLVNPMRRMPQAASAVNHITDEMLRGAPVMSDVAPLFTDFIGNQPLVGHNIIFDLNFIQNAGIDLLSQNRRYYDTLKLVKRTLTKSGDKQWDNDLGGYVEVEDYDVENFKLGTLCDYFGIPVDSAHRALSDARVTGLLFKEIVEAKLAKARA